MKSLFREILPWCLPALLVGLALRAALQIAMPYGYIQYDTADFLLTPFKLLKEHHYVMHPKKAFFSPSFFSIPFLLHIPALIFIPIAQHLMGLVEVIFAGALVRLWFPCWRWIIVPATVLIAASPWQIWYEQTLMGEANYVFFLFLVALAGTLWAQKPTRWRFAGFLLALFFLCGTRAEGKIIVLFGLALIPLVLWPRWKPIAAGLACLVAVFLLANRSGGGGDHAFSLLYATLFRLTPDEFRSEPGIAAYLIPLRDKVRDKDAYSTGLVRLAKKIGGCVVAYLREQKGIANPDRVMVANVERGLCIEILEREPWTVITTPLEKFRLASDGWPSGSRFDDEALRRRQIKASTRGHSAMDYLSKGLTGQPLDGDGWKAFIMAHYDPARTAWFDACQLAWSRCAIAARLPDRALEAKRSVHDFISPLPDADHVEPGVPLYFLLAFAGMAVALALPGPMRRVRAAWIAALLVTWYAATMVGVTNARFRFGYEPFCYMYAAAALVWAGAGLRRLITRKSATAKPCTAS